MVSCLIHLTVRASTVRVGTLLTIVWTAVQPLGLVVFFPGPRQLASLASTVTTGAGEVAIIVLVLAIVRRQAVEAAHVATSARRLNALSARAQQAAHLDDSWSHRVTEEALPLLAAEADGAASPDDPPQSLAGAARLLALMGDPPSRPGALPSSTRTSPGWCCRCLPNPVRRPPSRSPLPPRTCEDRSSRTGTCVHPEDRVTASVVRSLPSSDLASLIGRLGARSDGVLPMPARTPSAQPDFVTPSEKAVHERMMAQFDQDSLVLAGVRVSDQTKDHEADLVVLMPNSGIVVVETKGSHVWHDGGNWRIRRDGTDQVVHPVDQARDAAYALRHYVESDPRWGSRGRIRWGHHVVLTGTCLAADFALPDCPRWMVTGRGDLDRLGERVWETTWRHRTDARVPTRDDIDLVEEILTGRGLPPRAVGELAEEREQRANRMTTQQALLLRATRLLHRVEVRGGAGSGKTQLAIQQASDLASGRIDRQRRRVAVVCYSHGLAHHLRRELCVGSRSRQPAFVGTFEELGRRWGLQIRGDEPSHFWERELPALMAEAALTVPESQRFDAVVVDEGQDFATDWWQPLLLALREPDHGGLHVFSDERQRVFDRQGRPPVALVPLLLDENLRNTRQIAEAFAPLAPPMRPRGEPGAQVRFIACALDEAVTTADDQVEALFDEGWFAHDIALLTMGRRHPVQVERQQRLGHEGYWQGFWDDEDVFYGHVLGFKGMERRAVVLCVNVEADRDRAAEMLYVGLSRATDQLVVVGDPDVVWAIGGDEVARRLGIG
ncbi:NERD domain-containing protein [Luteococcus sp.]|uniref:nuclease-related domain-containing DEAD/DEAH box helicase n=1 Tax=Luteococcus sp. TaxID=1969402 RepID=UPI003734C826